MTIADMPENDIVNAARIQRLFVELQKRRKILVRHGHIGPDLFLLVPDNSLIHRNRQGMPKGTHLFPVLFGGRKPRPVEISIVFFKQVIPIPEEFILPFRRGLLFEKHCTGLSRWSFGKLLSDKSKGTVVKVFEQ